MVRANKEQPGGQFFQDLINDACSSPNKYADGMGRKNCVLEELHITSPLEPSQPTAAGLALQEVNDQRTIALLKYRLGPILTELKRKYKRCCKRVSEVFDFFHAPPPEVVVTPVDPVGVNGKPQPLVDANPDGNIINVMYEAGVAETTAVNDGRRSATATTATTTPITATASRAAGAAKAVRYGSGEEARAHEDLERLHKAQAIHTFTEISILEFNPALRMECQRMAVREWKRREEHRKNREKLKDVAQLLLLQYGNGNEAQCKGNWLGLDIRMTDRRRLHSEAGGDVSTDLHASEEGDGEGRESKRSRRAPGALDDQQDVDKLDTIGPSPVPSPGPQLHHQHHLHQTPTSTCHQPNPLPRAPLPPEARPSSSVLVERSGETN
ncbi:hypothetical protein JOM56_015201 [Amanita muscaria]